jgi:hypothetical protein
VKSVKWREDRNHLLGGKRIPYRSAHPSIRQFIWSIVLPQLREFKIGRVCRLPGPAPAENGFPLANINPVPRGTFQVGGTHVQTASPLTTRPRSSGTPLFERLGLQPRLISHMSAASSWSNSNFRHSLCTHCGHAREIVSGKGSRFLLCLRAVPQSGLPKYPPQPVLVCAGFESRRLPDDPDGKPEPLASG